MKKKYIGILSAIAVFLLVVLDQLTKKAAVIHLKGKASFELLPGVFELHYLENHGAAFGAFQNQRWFFLLVVFLVLAALIWGFWCLPNTAHYHPLIITSVFIAAGAIGNMIDRVVNGYVIDFLYFSLIDFPIFNIADIYVTAAMIVLFFLLFIFYKEDDFQFLKWKQPKKDC